MEVKKITSFKIILVLLLCCSTSTQVFAQGKSPFVQGNSYPVMHVVEAEFTSQLNYTNAYLNVDVWVNLTGPGGNYTIPVFWDGEDNNGNDIFRARLVATSTGTWNWDIINSTVTNSDSAFIGKSGSFNATSAGNANANANNHGFIRVAPNNHTLEYADGTPFFYTGDTSWSALTKVFGFDTANSMTEISFKDYFTTRKNQGFNGLNVIASFPNDTYFNLWSSETWGQKVGPNGETPFEVNGVVDYKKINPSYWQSVDIKMQYLADNGFVTMLETVRRTEEWPLTSTTQTEKDAFYNYVRYLWARYGCYNMIFSWVHHDVSGGVYNDWVPLVQHANSELENKIGGYKMPYGQPRTAMSFNTSLTNWNVDVPTALDLQNVSNAERDETMHQWLRDIYNQTNQPALNLEPFYPGWGLHSSNEINPGLNDVTMAQMQMYGSVLSGGLAGHAWGDAWYAGAAASTSNRIVPNNDPQEHALGEFLSGVTNQLENFESQAMGHLRTFMLDSDHEYERLIPAAHTNLSNSLNFIQTLSISDDKKFALGFFTTSYNVPNLTNLIASETYNFQWWDVTNGGWINAGNLTTNGSGQLVPPSRPDNSKNWAYRIRSLDYDPNPDPGSFALRINSGGSAVTLNGENFVADSYFDSGNTLDRPQTGLVAPFKSFRYNTSEVMGYDIPLDNGEYTVNLHFAELWFGATGGGTGGVGSRIFDVSIEDSLVEDNLDVFAQAGAEAVITKTHTVSITDGQLNIDFDSRAAVGGERHPIINAIEIIAIEAGNPPTANAGSDQTIALPTASAQLTGSGNDPDGGNIIGYAWGQVSGPSTATFSSATSASTTVSNLVEGSYTFQLTVTDDENDTASDTVILTVNPEPDPSGFELRINTGGSAVTYNGDAFTADNYFDAGSTLNRPQTGLVAPFKSFRYSTSEVMGYDIPLDNGEYTVKLHFAELWFGATGGGSGGVGSRIFDVSLEGNLVEDNLDVFAQAGADASITKTHTVNISDGQLNIDFDSRSAVGGERHPIINAIEILGAGGSNPIEGLVGHWPLDEQSGTIASDVSGEGYNGTLVNGLNFGSTNTGGQIGSALEFDGSNDRINLPDIDNDLQAGFSISTWINPDNTSGYQAIAGTHTSAGFMTFVHNGKLAFALRTNSGIRKLKSHGTIVANQWQHIAVTYDGSNMKWYIDGTQVGSEPHSGQVSDRNNGYIGWSGWSAEYFDGTIDDVKIFDNSLSQSQISDLAMQNPPSMPDDLSGRWPLDEQSGTTAIDISGQGYNGTLVNGINFGANTTSGQIGSALQFDGSDDRINLPDIDNDLQAGFSVSAWINPDNTSGYTAIAGTHTSAGFMTFVHNGKLAFALRTDSGIRKLKSYGAIVANQWQNIVATYDGTSMIWYIDGNEVGSEPHSGQVSDRNTGYIGWSGWSSEYFDGGIDDVRLYESALTASEVETLFQNGGGSTNLIAKADLSIDGAGIGFILPNPTKDRFRITGLRPGTREIMVSDFSSRVLMRLKTDKEEYELDLSTFPDGIYLVKVFQNGSEHTFKVVKE